MSVTDQLRSDASKHPYTDSLDSVNKKFPFIATLGGYYNNFYGHHNSLFDFLMLSEKHGHQNCICENTSRCGKLNLYFDFDSKTQKLSDREIQDTILSLKNKLSTFFPGVIPKIFVKDASNSTLTSLHFIVHLKTNSGHFIYIRNKDEMKAIFKLLELQSPFDIALYSGFNVRMLYSNKFDQKKKQWANRCFQISRFSFSENTINSLATHCPEDKFFFLSDYIKKQFVLDFVKNQGFTKEYSIDQVQIRDQDDHWSLMLTEQKCSQRDHKSNNSVAMLHSDNIIIKCLDDECQSCFYQKLRITDFSIEEIEGGSYTQSDHGDNNIEVNTNIQSQDEYTKIQSGCNEAIKSVYQCGYLTNFFNNVGHQTFSLNASPGKAPNLVHTLDVNPITFTGDNNQIHFKQNGRSFSQQYSPELQESLQSIDKTYTKNDLKKLQIVTNNIVYNNNITINNPRSKRDDDDDGTDLLAFIPIDNEQERRLVDKLFNRRMQYISQLYNLLKPGEFIYKPANDNSKTIYYFTNINNDRETDGGQWSNEDGTKELIKRVRNVLEDYFDNKKKQIDKKYHRRFNLVFNAIMNTVEQPYKMQQQAMETFKRKNILFNQNIHLLHFQNGTYDMEERKFIKTTSDMYNTQQIGYDFKKNAKYDFIEPVVKQIIGDNEYQWFIQQLAYCLMPDRILEKKQIVILTGQGDNGKTLLFNLMNNVVDTLAYGVNGRSLMIQATNEQLSNATPDLMTLKDMRFCYFGELDANKPFNQQQVKMLTGAEKVKGRNLYGNLDEFEAHAGLFVACNQIPRINTQDGGFINRLKIIELQKRFVERPDPNNRFQLKKDNRLLNQIKSMKWKQGFIKMLIDYHYKEDIEVPLSVQQYIQQKINLNLDPVHVWAEQHIVHDENDYMSLEELTDAYNSQNTGRDIVQRTFQEKFDQFLKTDPQKFGDVKYDRKNKPRNRDWKYGHLPKKMVFINIRLIDLQQNQ